MINTAVILAAGKGTRFGAMTEMRPKGFIPFNGVPMILRSIETLFSCGFEKIIIGTGYHSEYYEELSAQYPGILTVFSNRYAETNSMFTLYNVREAVGMDDFILLESDLVYERRAIQCLLEDPHPDVMLITDITKFQDQYYVEADARGWLKNCSTDESALKPDGELVGIHKLSNEFYQKMCDDYAVIMEDSLHMGYEYELLRMARTISPVHVHREPDLSWYEIDDAKDLDFAHRHLKL